VQEAALPICLEGKDVLVKAKTGTGKSAAFLVIFTREMVLSDILFDPMFLFNQFIQNGLINSFLQLNQS